MEIGIRRIAALLVLVAFCWTAADAAETGPSTTNFEPIAAPEGRGILPPSLSAGFQDLLPQPTFNPPDPPIDLSPWRMGEPYWRMTVDYRYQTFFESHTSYQFGMPEWVSPTWAPLSKLDWSLDSTWHGVEIGLEGRTERFHFRWMKPLTNIDGHMADFDWLTPSAPSQLDSLTLSSLNWKEGQMIDFGGEMQLSNYLGQWPIEIWPTIGFRWQRFNMVAYDIDYLVPPDGFVYQGPVITFSQQYYFFYLGGQLRMDVVWLGLPINLKFEGDWSATWGYNSDHHLLRDDGTRFTMESTRGDTAHLAVAAEATFTQHLSLGVRLDHMAIHTTGTHRWVVHGMGIDEKWSHGVEVKSDQTSATVYARLRF